MSNTVNTPTSLLYAYLTGNGVDIYQQAAPNAIEGTGSVYAVLMQGEQGWQRDAWHVHVIHPRIYVNIYADCARDDDGNPVALDALDRALGAYKVLDGLLDGTTHDDWQNQIVSCRREGEMSTFAVPREDNSGPTDSIMLNVVYEVSMVL